MSLLSSRTLASQTRSITLPLELWSVASCMLSTSAPQLAATRKTTQTPSRTRLVKDLVPKRGPSEHFKETKRARLEVAPKTPFTRDPVPHPEAKDLWRAREMFAAREQARQERRSGKRYDGGDGMKKTTEAKPSIPAENLDSRLKLSSVQPDLEEKSKPRRKIANPLPEEFDRSQTMPTTDLPTDFASPPLLDGLLSSVMDILGPQAKPTPIQSLSMKHLVPLQHASPAEATKSWGQYLLASETGSGKSIAYLLPVLQDLKLSELRSQKTPPPKYTDNLIRPRALVLAPTHELSRQLSGFAKELLHNIKLRVLCASRPNAPSTSKKDVSSSKMANHLEDKISMVEGENGEIVVSTGGGFASRYEQQRRPQRPVDLLVGTPTKALEMVRGRYWEREVENAQFEYKGKPEMSLENIEWVIVDEADVLFDPDFQESTRMLLADIAKARGHPVEYQPELVLPDANATVASKAEVPKVEIPQYPFNLLLTTATIPAYLASYLDTYHPSLTRLASPNLHKLPSTLKAEFEKWTGGRKNKDIENAIRKIWWHDAMTAGAVDDHPPRVDIEGSSEEAVSYPSSPTGSPKSKILIFCNRSSKVEELGTYLTEQGIPNVALTSTAESRHRGNNHHLDGFMRIRDNDRPAKTGVTLEDTQAEQPHVLITTSLLSRGLDFSQDVKHVFIVDNPRNMVDFLHRAGRSGRAGQKGKVVVFGKEKGRGSDKDKDVKRRVRALR